MTRSKNLQKIKQDDWNQILNNKFSPLSGRLSQGFGSTCFIEFSIKIPQTDWNQAKKKNKDPIDALRLVVDLSNFLYRSIGLGVHYPMVGGINNRCKQGFKHLTFRYVISYETYQSLGGYGSHVHVGPIQSETNKLKLA